VGVTDVKINFVKESIGLGFDFLLGGECRVKSGVVENCIGSLQVCWLEFLFLSQ